MSSEMFSLHLTHPSVHTWSSGQPTVQRPGSSRGLPARAGIIVWFIIDLLNILIIINVWFLDLANSWKWKKNPYPLSVSINHEELEKSQGLWILLWTVGGFGVNRVENRCSKLSFRVWTEFWSHSWNCSDWQDYHSNLVSVNLLCFLASAIF